MSKNDVKSNSNLNCDVELRFDGSVNFCGVAEWLYTVLLEALLVFGETIGKESQ